MPEIFKKLVLVLATSVPIIKVNKEDNMVLKRVFYIYYPIQFQKNKMQVLINLGNKVNAMILTYAAKLNLQVCSTNIKAQKIDSSILKMFEIILTSFKIENKLNRLWFF